MDTPHLAAPARAFADVTINISLCTVHRHGIILRLTEREFQMFQLLLTKPIVTVPEFAKLAQRVDGTSKSTARGYIVKLRRKLAPIGLAIDAYYARGFVLREL